MSTALTRTADTVGQMLAANADALNEALARHVDADRLIRVSLAQIRKTPALAKCSPVSLAQAIMEAGRLGVEPGLLGQAYLVPYGTEATLIVGYRGLIELARRSGNVTKVEARIVHEHDAFEVEFGSSARFSHRPNLFGDRGKPIGVYAEATYADAAGTVQREFMTVAEVEAIRARSKAGRSGPWVSDWAEMAKKTAVRRLVKMLPLSIEDAAAIERIDALEFGDRRERRAAAVVDVEQVYSLTPDADDSPDVATVDDYEAMPVGDA
jgi:recombination protein RecT